VLGGILALGAFFDAISNAISLVTLPVAIASSLLLLGMWGATTLLLKRYPLRWRGVDGSDQYIKTLGPQPRFFLVGMIALLWCSPVLDWVRGTTRDALKENHLTTFPTPFPFGTGWVFVGYHDSWSWTEGPMTRIVNWSIEGRQALRSSDNRTALDAVRELFDDTPSGARSRLPYGERFSAPSGELIRHEENVIRFRSRLVEPQHANGIPALGDVLRVEKLRRIVIADFRTRGMQHQLLFPGTIKGRITDEDETGVQVPVGGLVIVRDVKLGAYPGRPAAVWCRVAACEHGIPQCDQALEHAGASKRRQ
jgi:hypothetical protein